MNRLLATALIRLNPIHVRYVHRDPTVACIWCRAMYRLLGLP